MIYLGIDPGASGGMAAITSVSKRNEKGWVLGTKDLYVRLYSIRDLATLYDVYQHAYGWLATYYDDITVGMELVSGFMGVARTGKSMFTFGNNNGALIGLLAALDLRPIMVRPQTWQAYHKIPHKKKSETDTQWKSRLKRVASKLFPKLKLTNATADALLIAEYMRQTKQVK